jgi:hypothetical protein
MSKEKYIIERSDSMDADYVRIPTEPKITIIKGHKLRAKDIGADKWVDTYDKFLNALFVLVFSLFITSCNTDEISTEDYVSYDNSESVSVPIPKVLNGLYQVDYVVHEYTDGSTLLFTYEDSPYWEERDGQMAQTTYEFVGNKLIIGQLMNNGWKYGDVSVDWSNGMPTRVGCKYVDSATDNFISWVQVQTPNNVLIKHYLTKL